MLKLRRYVLLGVRTILDVGLLPPLILLALIARLRKEGRISVGLGPLPLINSLYHKKALRSSGYTAETFVDTVWHISSEFDVRADLWAPSLLILLRPYILTAYVLWRYQCLYLSFSGGALQRTPLGEIVEPFVFKLASIRTVLLPYGSDVYDPERCENYKLVHAMDLDYPELRYSLVATRRRVKRWSKYGDFVVVGCDWGDYLDRRDKLLLSHFAIDTEDWAPVEGANLNDFEEVRVLHAPNHRNLKGTSALYEAISNLKRRGYQVTLELVEGKPNYEVKAAIERADIVVDQLLIGWYAMFAIEAMAVGKPTICYIRPDIRRWYEEEGLIELGELPLISATEESIEGVLVELIERRGEWEEIGNKSRRFVCKNHSILAMGKIFSDINKDLGIERAGSLQVD